MFLFLGTESSLKDIFLNKKHLWEPIFKNYMNKEKQPDFSTYRKPFLIPDDKNEHCEKLLHILYMKSNAKALSRNFNA